jgi:pimeloyl-ACP methyl ester carboxylesterase
VVLPQWNADAGGHGGLCRGLRRVGIGALRLSLPWHDVRKPEGMARAEYTVDGNLGRTIHAARQAVCDVRACLDWLQARGYQELAILGTSLGSCYALLATAHEPRLQVNVFNHVSPWFGDVVWTGLATQHVRDSFAGRLDRGQLRAAWLAISPIHYLPRMAGTGKRNLLIYARYDLTFLPELSRQAVAEFERLGIRHEVKVLPCGHNTTGQKPFLWLDGYWMVQFLRKWL